MLVRSPKSNIFSSTSLKLGRGSVLLLTALVFYWHCGSCGKKCQGVQTLAVVTLILSLLTDPTISSIPEGYQLRFSSGKNRIYFALFSAIFYWELNPDYRSDCFLAGVDGKFLEKQTIPRNALASLTLKCFYFLIIYSRYLKLFPLPRHVAANCSMHLKTWIMEA